MLVYLWVDGPSSVTSTFPAEHTLPKFCNGSEEVSNALLFAAAMGHWKRQPVYVVKGYLERSMGAGATFYPPVWVSQWITRDVLPLYVSDFNVREYDGPEQRLWPAADHFMPGPRGARKPRVHRAIDDAERELRTRLNFNYGGI